MKRIVLIATWCVLGIALQACHIDTISPRDMTATALGETSFRIELYFEAHKKLPQSLTDLPVREGYLNRTTDGWNRPFLFDAGKNTIVLRSYGADGVAGGSGDNSDWERKITKVPLTGTLWQVERKFDGGKTTITDRDPF